MGQPTNAFNALLVHGHNALLVHGQKFRLPPVAEPKAGGLSHYTEPPVRGTQQFLEAYDTAPWVRAMSNRVAAAVGETRWQLGRSDSDQVVPRDHLMLRTLRKPNTLMSGSSLIRVTQLSLDLVGDSFWLLSRNALGVPFQYWPIPAHWVIDLPTSQRQFFKISWQSWQAEIPESEMIWIHEASPADPYGRGHGIIQALADEVNADEFAAKHVGTMFFNRAMPEVVVQDVGAGEDEIRAHERAWNTRLQGLFKAMKPYFVNRELKFWQPQQMNLENLTLVPLRTFHRDIMLQCWGIPPEQLGIVENSNRATAEASDFIFESRVVKPRRQFLADELTLKLAPYYDERIEVQFTDVTPKDRKFELDTVKAFPSAFRVNEVRELVGREPLPDGDVRIVRLSEYLTTDLQDPEQRPQNVPGAPKPEEPDERDQKLEEIEDKVKSLIERSKSRKVLRDEAGRISEIIEE